MANVSVSFQEMHDAATRLAGGQEQITSQLSDLQVFIGGLITSGFVTDQASVAFGEQYEKFTSETTALVSTLTDIGGYLRQAAQVLQDADQGLAAGLRR